MNRHGDSISRRRKLVACAAGLMGVAVPIMFGLSIAAQSRAQSQPQSPGGPAPLFVFEVATIKPHKPDPGSGVMSGQSWPPDGFVATNVTLQTLILNAYGVRENQVVGAPDWARSESYDIDAKMDAAVADELKKLGMNDLFRARQQMLQALLADRFKLALHRETRELPVYSLVITKNGPKIKQAPPDEVYAKGAKGTSDWSRTAGGGGKFTGHGIEIGPLAGMLTQTLGRNVVDKTGLTGDYDITLQWAASDAGQASVSGGAENSTLPEPTGATIFTALQEQLGLKLEPTKAPVGIIVIEHVERPSGN
jgi:uncharacterized protein (TIGR03435 family)